MDCLTLKKSNCKNCYKCIRHCPVKSIRFSGNQAYIIGNECILCGQCFVVCPQNAKEIRNDTGAVRELIAAGRLDGVEIDHPRNTPEDRAELTRLAKENGLIVTGGTDYHGINTVTPRPVGAFTTSDEMIARIGDIAKARKSTYKRQK